MLVWKKRRGSRGKGTVYSSLLSQWPPQWWRTVGLCTPSGGGRGIILTAAVYTTTGLYEQLLCCAFGRRTILLTDVWLAASVDVHSTPEFPRPQPSTLTDPVPSCSQMSWMDGSKWLSSHNENKNSQAGQLSPKRHNHLLHLHQLTCLQAMTCTGCLWIKMSSNSLQKLSSAHRFNHNFAVIIHQT
jgi:hypothetical protein